jgi:hypothetical protein
LGKILVHNNESYTSSTPIYTLLRLSKPLFGLREIEEREIEKREREKKLEFSSVWQAEKVGRENNDWWAPRILVFSLDMRRKCKDGTKHCKMTFMPLNITCSILFFLYNSV